MTPIELIRAHEGLRLKVYADNDGSATIGYGQHLDSLQPDQIDYLNLKYPGGVNDVRRQGITFDDAERLLEMKVNYLRTRIGELHPFVSNLTINRLAVVLDMTYEMGIGWAMPTSKAFWPRFWGSLEAADYPACVVDMASSHWARQVPSRYENDVKLMSIG